jgi:hypothetical protein
MSVRARMNLDALNHGLDHKRNCRVRIALEAVQQKCLEKMLSLAMTSAVFYSFYNAIEKAFHQILVVFEKADHSVFKDLINSGKSIFSNMGNQTQVRNFLQKILG